MSSSIKPPSRTLDEFEELVYDYSAQTGQQHQEAAGWDFDPRACNLRFESATRGPPAQVSYLLTVAPKLCNFLGTLHGGCAATIIDVLSSAILLGISKPGFFSLGGVSRNLKVTYLRPVPVNTEIRLVCQVIHTGRRLALLRAEISRADNGDLCVLGEHEKANTDPESSGKI